MGNLFAEAKLKTALANDTYTDKKEIVSKAGYLLGVDKNIFDSGELLSEIYEELEKNQDARMVRNLCHYAGRTANQLCLCGCVQWSQRCDGL